MAKKFAFVSIGILCLALSALIGFHIGSQSAGASVVLASNGIIASADARALDEFGVIWEPDTFQGWIERTDLILPVPVTDIKFWDTNLIITNQNFAYRAASTGVWEPVGQWPGSPVPVSPDTWGSVKDKYKGNPKD